MPLLYLFCALTLLSVVEPANFSQNCEKGILSSRQGTILQLENAPIYMIFNYTYNTTNITCLQDYLERDIIKQMKVINYFYEKALTFQMKAQPPNMRGFQSVTTTLNGNHVSAILIIENVSENGTMNYMIDGIKWVLMPIYGDVRGGKFRTPCGQPITASLDKLEFMCRPGQKMVAIHHQGYCSHQVIFTFKPPASADTIWGEDILNRTLNFKSTDLY